MAFFFFLQYPACISFMIQKVRWKDVKNAMMELKYINAFFFKKALSILQFTLLVIELLVVHGGLLVLLVLGHEVVHVGLSLGELHLVHALAGVPMEESLSSEHGSELLGDSLEELLDGGGVADEGGGHLETSGGNVADSGLDIVGDPLHEVGGVLVLDSENLLVNLLHGHPAPEDGGDSEISAVPGVAGRHHVLGVEHLLGQLGHGESSVLLGATGCQGGEPGHEEVKPGEGDHVDRQLPEVSIELAGEPEAGGHTGHGEGHQVVQVSVGRGGELKGPEADVVESLVVDTVGLVSVLDQLWTDRVAL